jgi:hypothetical protein
MCERDPAIKQNRIRNLGATVDQEAPKAATEERFRSGTKDDSITIPTWLRQDMLSNRILLGSE